MCALHAGKQNLAGFHQISVALLKFLKIFLKKSIVTVNETRCFRNGPRSKRLNGSE